MSSPPPEASAAVTTAPTSPVTSSTAPSATADSVAPNAPRILLVVTGSIAAYKAVLLTRRLLGTGADVRVAMTRSAHRFVGSATFAGLTGQRVLDDHAAEGAPGELHVELAGWADLVLVVPATADLIARMAAGRADDLVTATLLCATCPVLLAPAMHPAMWSHPATQRNVAQLGGDGRVALCGPVNGEVASGERGVGRMAEPEEILAAALATLGQRDLAGQRIVVSAGPTVEDLDPVRFIGNRSSGKMGFAIAARAAARGARVTLVAGPVALPTPARVERVDVRSALEMQTALDAALGAELDRADVLVMAAAVGDYRPAERRVGKVKRSSESADGSLSLTLIQNPDILAALGSRRRGQRPVLVGFAVETGSDEDVTAYARRKLGSKRVDVVVANHAADSLGRDDNRVTLVHAEGARPLPVMSKLALADRLLDWIAARLAETAR